MAVKTINTEMLQKMFLAGAANLDAKKEFINELNVFPVPDGDTGTNMTLTIMSAAKEVQALDKPDMVSMAKAISSGGGQEEIPVLSFPSFSVDLQKKSGNMMKSTLQSLRKHVTVRLLPHTKQS